MCESCGAARRGRAKRAARLSQCGNIFSDPLFMSIGLLSKGD